MNHRERVQSRYRVLLRDFGYEVAGNRLIRKGVRGLLADQLLPYRVRGLMDACEMVRPMIADAEFNRRLDAIGAE